MATQRNSFHNYDSCHAGGLLKKPIHFDLKTTRDLITGGRGSLKRRRARFASSLRFNFGVRRPWQSLPCHYCVPPLRMFNKQMMWGFIMTLVGVAAGPSPLLGLILKLLPLWVTYILQVQYQTSQMSLFNDNDIDKMPFIFLLQF